MHMVKNDSLLSPFNGKSIYFSQMREQPFFDRRFIYNFIQNQNEMDNFAVDVMQFYTVLGI